MTAKVYCIFSKPNDREMTKYTIFPAFLPISFSVCCSKTKQNKKTLDPPTPCYLLSPQSPMPQLFTGL